MQEKCNLWFTTTVQIILASKIVPQYYRSQMTAVTFKVSASKNVNFDKLLLKSRMYKQKTSSDKDKVMKPAKLSNQNHSVNKHGN